MKSIEDSKNHDETVRTYRQLKRPAPVRTGYPETSLTRWLNRETWTAREAALLVAGIDPGTLRETPDGEIISASGLCGSVLASEADFRTAVEVLDHWKRLPNPPGKISPADFVAWCKTRNIDTQWLRDVPSMPREDGDFVPLDVFIVELAEQRWSEYIDDDREISSALKKAGGAPLNFHPFYAAQVLEQVSLRQAIDTLVSTGKLNLYDPKQKLPTSVIVDALVVRHAVDKMVSRVPRFPDSPSPKSLRSDAFPAALAILHQKELAMVGDHTDSSEPLMLEDLFRLDNWTVEAALPIVLGLEPESVVKFRGELGTLQLVNARYLDGSLVDLVAWREWQEFCHMRRYRRECPSMEQHFVLCLPLLSWAKRLDRLEQLWASGSHPQRNPPGYYIEWAQRKGVWIPWLEWAHTKGLATPQPVVAALSSDAATSSATSRTHRIGRRSNPMRAVIEMATQAAVDPEDYVSVWDALVDLAKSDHPPPPVLEYLKSSGVRWRNTGKNGEDTVKIFTKDALRKRLVPNAR